MHRTLQLLAATAFGVAVWAPTASAQTANVVAVEGTTISVGGGTAFLTLPDTKFTFRYDNDSGDTVHKQTNLDYNAFSDYGGGFTGSIQTPLGGWVGAVHGFWSSINNNDTNTCKNTGGTTCAAADLVDEPGPSTVSAVDVLKARTSKDVDLWGVAVELDRPTGAPMLPGLFHSTYWGAGFDVRGIDQDMRIKGYDFTTNLFRYDETLDTTYYGGFISFGGEYTLGMLGMGGLWERWGLRSFFEAHAGLYSANTDYDGRFSPTGFDPSKLGLSHDNVAFIGGIKFETRKQLGPRTSLSLLSEYEYYSWVPDMRYNDGDDGVAGIVDKTQIGNDDAFSGRTSLRLNIGLGSSGLYGPPAY
jgi:hypothetical protein